MSGFEESALLHMKDDHGTRGLESERAHDQQEGSFKAVGDGRVVGLNMKTTHFEHRETE